MHQIWQANADKLSQRMRCCKAPAQQAQRPHTRAQRTSRGERVQAGDRVQGGQLGERAHALAAQLLHQLVVHMRQLQQRRVALRRRLLPTTKELKLSGAQVSGHGSTYDVARALTMQ